MTTKTLLFCSVPFLFTVGCVETHRPRTVYKPVPVAVATPVVTPTSDRPPERVYPPGVSSRDLAIADSVRDVMRGEVVIPSVGNNVQARVEDGVVTLTGTVATDTEKDEMVDRISKLPGVVAVRDRTTVSVR